MPQTDGNDVRSYKENVKGRGRRDRHISLSSVSYDIPLSSAPLAAASDAKRRHFASCSQGEEGRRKEVMERS